jgi:group II intron reverse transcriptase/maturase
MNAFKANNLLNEKAQELQEKLYLSAKKSKTRRFHAIYDKVYRIDILWDAWKIVKMNKGCSGIDGVTIEDIIEYGEEQYIQELHDLLLDTHMYHPIKIKRVYIPKADGSKRPLGIPSIKDRIVQTATKLMIEPIFEADFLDYSYGFRPNKSAHEALEQIRILTNKGYNFIIDADIKGYFDNINHEELIKLIYERINDRRIIKIIRKWLKCGIINELEENEIGTPQGGVISPLLANIYLHEFDKFWSWQTIERGKLIRYADDFVILCKSQRDAEIGMRIVKAKMNELKLQLNEKKTKIIKLSEKEGFDFLGFHHRKVMSWKYKKLYTQTQPKKTAVTKIKQKIKDKTAPRSNLDLELSEIVRLLNPQLRGWSNYFKYGNSSKVFCKIDRYVQESLALWNSKKHQRGGRNWAGFTYKDYRNSGIYMLTGNVTYWSQSLKA